jgi:cellulose synthase operon protein YhjQ
MDDQHAQHGALPEREDLAKDVARLYSWAHVKGASYRAFSRQRKPEIRPRPLSELRETPLPSITEPSEPPDHAGAPSIESSNAAASAAFKFPPTGSETATAPPPVNPQASRRAALLEPNSSPGGKDRSVAIAVGSLAGGVGKTTITANLGRVLASLGERVLLVDASGSGLLPFYFGSSDLRPGLRTFCAPEPSCPQMDVIGSEDITREWLENDVKAAMQTAQRTVFDLGPGSAAILTEVLQMCAVLLVPLLTDLNSILTVSRIESFLSNMRAKEVDVPLPFYVSNKYDERSPRDRQGRELILRQVGDRLLPMTIRRSPDVAEAIGEGMTVADHSPESDIARDFLELALWLRKSAPIPKLAKSPGRWSER